MSAISATTTYSSFTQSDVAVVVLDHTVRLCNDLVAFVETGSSHPFVLSTVNECNYLGQLRELCAGDRTYQGKKGVRLVAKFDGPPPFDVVVELTLCQAGATHYAHPIVMQD